MERAFAGIDVSFAKGKRLPVVICTWNCGRLIPKRLQELSVAPPRGSGNVATLSDETVRGFAREAAAYLQDVSRRLGLRIVRIGIDAPRAPATEGVRRAAEVAMDRVGVSCIATPSRGAFKKIKEKVTTHLDEGGAESTIPHANQLWMLVGFALYKELSSVAECIEVFPQATVQALGVGHQHKSGRGVAEAQLSAAARFTGWPTQWVKDPQLGEIAWGPAHDLVDAYLSAWTAALSESDRVALGTPPEDAIWIPRLPEGMGLEGAAKGAEKQSEEESRAEHRRVCPACGEKEFRRWPFGWDAHAAHRCKGLREGTPDARKTEFRMRFQHLFSG